MNFAKKDLKRRLGNVPFLAELDWWMRGRGESGSGFKLDLVEEKIVEWEKDVKASTFRHLESKKVFMFCTLNYWIHHGVLFGLTLASFGHDVTLSFLPYNKWDKEVLNYTQRQDNLYGKSVLKKAQPFLKNLSLLDVRLKESLPEELQEKMKLISERDVQYTNQVEDVDKESELYQFRLKRNSFAGGAAFNWLKENRPDVVLVPNGMILEFGAVFQAARYLDIPVTSYEFGEQQNQIWFSQNQEVMMQDTREMWAERKDRDFTEDKQEKIQELFTSRQKADLWQNFSRRWQNLPSEGGEAAREKLGLDERPIVLLAANVIGDSLTLGRQVFSETMTEWLVRTFEYFSERDEVQFVLRVHPGERYLEGGPSVADIARKMLPEPPEHFQIVEWDALINTYDLASIADVGLVYTTTTGMEMAMGGVPVIVSGWTHYRGKGFTQDPESWNEYFAMLEKVMANPKQTRLTDGEVKTAWHYAYCFFFDFPRPFPWTIANVRKSIERLPMRQFYLEYGLDKYGKTFDYLIGEPIDWKELD